MEKKNHCLKLKIGLTNKLLFKNIIFIFIPLLGYTQSHSGFFKKNNNEKIIEKTEDVLKVEVLISEDTIIDENIIFLNSPVENGIITSSYSKSRFHPIQKKYQAHKGTDFYAPYGSPIKATAGGIVEDENYTSVNGNYVKIKHDDIYSTQYLHMSEIIVRTGQIIKQGDTIGLVGSTGLATGPHVCYRFWKNGKQIDPFALDNLFEEKTEDLSQEENKETKEFKTFITGFFRKEE